MYFRHIALCKQKLRWGAKNKLMRPTKSVVLSVYGDNKKFKILTGKTELSMKKHVENRKALTRTTSLTVKRLLSCSVSFASAGTESWSLSFGPMADTLKVGLRLTSGKLNFHLAHVWTRRMRMLILNVPASHAMIKSFSWSRHLPLLTMVTQYFKQPLSYRVSSFCGFRSVQDTQHIQSPKLPRSFYLQIKTACQGV